ncbi:TolB family protein [Occallatibacter savannae]|uniref:TolB family protein n=1 Tax=Occallatibacter savannae TaxID=1002691 RepID=UPI000D686B09|nr:PD40 domain-containing protein [Occallatibacter savannae]
MNDYNASWSPDGKSVLFTSDLAPALPHLEIFNIETRQASVVPGSEGSWLARWSPDGKHLAALSVDGELKLFDGKSSTWNKVRNDVNGLAWSHDSRSMYVIREKPTPAILRLSLAGKKEQEVASLKEVQISDTVGVPLFVTPRDEPLIRQQTALETEIYALFWDPQ